MFLRINVFQGFWIIGPVLWIAGTALVLSAASISVFLRAFRVAGGPRGPERVRVKRLGAWGIVLVGAGTLCFAVLRPGPLYSEHYEFLAPGENEIAKLYYQPLKGARKIPLREMIRKSGQRIVNEEIEITQNGFLETPFVFFPEGKNTLAFDASGTEQDKMRLRILVGLLVLGEDGTQLGAEAIALDLTERSKTYSIPLDAAGRKVCAVRIEFLNAGTDLRTMNRVAKVSRVVLRHSGAE